VAEDDTAKPLSPLEIKLAAIAAAGAARHRLSMHVPAAALAEPETVTRTEEAAAQPVMSVEADVEKEVGAESQRAEENAMVESTEETPPLATQFAAMPPEGESPPVQPAIPDATIYVDSGGAAQIVSIPEDAADAVPEAGVGTAPVAGEHSAPEAASPAAYTVSEDTTVVVPASALRAPAVVDPSAAAEAEPRHRLPVLAPSTPGVAWTIDAEYAATAGLLGAVLVIGLATVSNYAITPDEFRYDELGTRLLSLYGGDREAVSATESNVYAQWFQVLTAALQSFIPANRFDVRHALTFLIGLGGVAALLPLGRLAIGRWAGLTAIVLCLLTGNFYGHLFFSPSDVPFMAAMTWATMAIVLMASRSAPAWGAVIIAGLFTGLAIATRPAGFLSHAFLLLAMLLCAFEAVFRSERRAFGPVLRIILQTVMAIGLAWIVAIALLPTLHAPDLLKRLGEMFSAAPIDKAPASVLSWGREWSTGALPWHYLPGELLARLSGVFVALLGLALLLALGSFILFLSRRRRANSQTGSVGTPALMFLLLVRSRAALIVTLAALLPILIAMIARPPLYDGIRLVLFIVPPLALLAAWGFLRLTPLIRTFPIVAAALIGIQIGGGVLVLASQHPLEYITTNAFAGGTRGSYARFELDYWGAAATEALRKLEQRLDYDRSGRFASEPPHILLCPYPNEHLDSAIFKRDWAIAEGRLLADFIIETRKSRCAQGAGTLIDEVKRRDQPFAWTLELPRSASPRDEISD
jgi:hypothetical protein